MNETIAQLYQLGDPRLLDKKKGANGWHNYIQLGFTQEHIPELIALVQDETLSTSSDRNAVWVPLYAWRTLGQLRAVEAVEPLVSMLDFFFKVNDEWAITEMSEVLGLIGQPAIRPLLDYILDHSNSTPSRSIVSEGLGKIAAYHLKARDEVLNAFHVYLTQADYKAKDFNALLICVVMHLNAAELIDDIRQLYVKDAINIAIAGTLDAVEANLGLREKPINKGTPKTFYDTLETAPPDKTYTREEPKIGRNDPCTCGSGKKYKKCCLH